jgi:serine/threonine-protein kinase
MAADGDFRRFGPYLVLRTFGAGGMARIDVAIRADPPAPTGARPQVHVLKRMHADFRSADQEARFRREARIAAGLHHPAIARTVSVDEIDGELVLLQELVHGVNLAQLETRAAAAGERLPVAVAVYVVREIARALDYAHAFGGLGIVHRDVTPDNVMLAFSGDVKLVDFGLARSDADTMRTGADQIVGRPVYTPPEVWEGAAADRRADIYSLGVVLWQLLTGRRLEARPGVEMRGVPAELAAVATRALAPAPEDRFQTAGGLAEALCPFLPASRAPGRALARVVSRYFDVERERRMMADEVRRAHALVLGTGGRRRRGFRMSQRMPIVLWVAISAVFAVFMVWAWVRASRNEGRPAEAGIDARSTQR